MFRIFLAISTMALVSAGGATKEVRQNFLGVGSLTECDGKDAGNYTFLGTFTYDRYCNPESFALTSDTSLTLVGPHGQSTVNHLKILALSGYPAGAYIQSETLFLALSGNLEGKYVYKKNVNLLQQYLKKCSSVLGYSYVTSKSYTFLISDKLDINVLISPQGGYEVFKRGCSTVCNGQEYVV